jgi:hypothetical protein
MAMTCGTAVTTIESRTPYLESVIAVCGRPSVPEFTVFLMHALDASRREHEFIVKERAKGCKEELPA